MEYTLVSKITLMNFLEKFNMKIYPESLNVYIKLQKIASLFCLYFFSV